MGPDDGSPVDRSAADEVPLSAYGSDRERTAQVIKDAFLEGRLDQDEYAERMRLALTSGTGPELAALVTDLPAGMLAVPVSAAVPATTAPAASVDLAAAILCVISVAMAVSFFKGPFSPLELLASIIFGGIAWVRAGRGPVWERVAVWGVCGAMGVALVGFIAAIFI